MRASGEVRTSSKDIKDFAASLTGLFEELMHLERFLNAEQAQCLVSEKTPVPIPTLEQFKQK